MHYVSLIVEFLRGRPRFVFWCAALTQAALWVIVPALSYSAPPGDVPTVLAIGHELLLGSEHGPPLAFWLSEGAFRIAGIFGVYVLAQICIVLTYYALFLLGRAIVGIRHAVLAVLLMVGISAFTMQSVAFGPPVLAAPFWAFSLLFYWRALGENARGAWFLLAIALGLLLLSSETGAILLALTIVFTLAAPAGRRALMHPEPWAAGVLLAVVVFPYALWAARARDVFIAGLLNPASPSGHPAIWLASLLAASHLGMLLLIALASGFPRNKKQTAPEIDRTVPVSPLASMYVYVFAVVPMFVSIAIALDTARLGPLGRITPLVVLSALAVLVAAGDRIRLFRERVVSSVARACGRHVLCRCVRAAHRQAAALRRRRSAARPAGGFREPQPAACLFRLGAAAEPVGQRGRHQARGRRAGVARARQRAQSAGAARRAVSRSGAGSAADLLAAGERIFAAGAHRLGGDPAGAVMAVIPDDA
jgi:hypothetical protein